MRGRKEGLGKEQELGRLVKSFEDPEKSLVNSPALWDGCGARVT